MRLLAAFPLAVLALAVPGNRTVQTEPAAPADFAAEGDLVATLASADGLLILGRPCALELTLENRGEAWAEIPEAVSSGLGLSAPGLRLSGGLATGKRVALGPGWKVTLPVALPGEGDAAAFTPLDVAWSLPGWTAATVTLDVLPDLSDATADIETTAGTMSARLFFDQAPRTVANFVRLAEDGFYGDTLFHRVIPGFMIQGGDPNSKDDDPANDGSGGPEWTVPAEFGAAPHVRGTLSMARNGDQVFGPLRQVLPNVLVQIFGLQEQKALDALMAELEEGGLDLTDRPSYLDSAGSQFFVVHAETPRLDGQYTAFGVLSGGLEVLDAIAATPTTGSSPTPPTAPDRPLADQKILSVTIHRSGGSQ